MPLFLCTEAHILLFIIEIPVGTCGGNIWTMTVHDTQVPARFERFFLRIAGQFRIRCTNTCPSRIHYYTDSHSVQKAKFSHLRWFSPAQRSDDSDDRLIISIWEEVRVGGRLIETPRHHWQKHDKFHNVLCKHWSQWLIDAPYMLSNVQKEAS